MTGNHHTKSIAEQATILGWHFQVSSVYTDDWTSVALLKPERTEAQLRQQYGTIREVTELVVMDANIVDEDTRERVRTIGWHFEDYNPQTETWEAVPTLDAKLTKAQLCEQHDSIRNIKPVARLAEVAAATYGESAPDVEDFTMSPSEHTDSHGR